MLDYTAIPTKTLNIAAQQLYLMAKHAVSNDLHPVEWAKEYEYKDTLLDVLEKCLIADIRCTHDLMYYFYIRVDGGSAGNETRRRFLDFGHKIVRHYTEELLRKATAKALV